MISFQNSDNQDIDREIKIQRLDNELAISVFSNEIETFYATDDQVFEIAKYLVNYLKAKGYSR